MGQVVQALPFGEVGSEEESSEQKLQRLQARLERAEGVSEDRFWFVSQARSMQSIEETLLQMKLEFVKQGHSPCVWLFGVSGNGVEGIARRVYGVSSEKFAPWIAVNCLEYTKESLAGVLFGSERTGGLLELARNGTLFLNHMQVVDLSVQKKLMLLAQNKGIRWIGAWDGAREELESRFASGMLSREIYDALKPMILEIPSLKERPEDILPMARQFAEKSFQAHGLLFEGFSSYWEDELQGPLGPSSVESLAHQMEALALTSEISALGYRAFKKTFSHAFETKYLAELLTKTGGNVSQSARLAEIDRSNFLRLLRKHHLKSEAFRKNKQDSK